MTDDIGLQEAVLAELGWDPSVDAAHVGVTAHDGVVTLTGHVEAYAQKHAAEAAALRVRGVAGVADDLEVLLPFERTRGDDEIAAAVLERLAWDESVPRDSVKVVVSGGWIILSGEVDWNFQKEAAADHVRSLTGVVGVSNDISLRAKVDASNLSFDIIHALHRSWFFDDNRVVVTANGGDIRLSGSVRSPHERQVAAATAWAAPGVTSVENELTVV
jgi:osmotically-inducible protein OsmY